MKKIFNEFKALFKRESYSIRTQIFSVTAFFVICGTLLIMFANSQFISVYNTFRQRNSLENACEEITQTDESNFYTQISNIEETYNVDVEIFNKNGKIIYDTAVNRFIQNWNDGSEIDLFEIMKTRNLVRLEHKDLKDGGYFEVLQDKSNHLQYLMYGKTFENGNTVKLYSQTNFIKNTANVTTRFVSIVACLSFILIITSLYVYVHHITKPLLEMNKITRRMAEMDFSQKCPPYHNNEIGELGRSINTLSSSLDSTLKDLQSKNEQLEEEIEHERKVEKMRKEFVSNASHELKTPIAIIQGYAEGLKLGIKSNEYCDIIIEETHKMNRLVCEMMELSKYESGTYILHEAPFDIKTFIEESLDSYQILAQEHSIELTTDIPDGLTGYGDTDRLLMVINNYVSNALSHAKNEMKIEVTAQELEDRVRINVFNTGDNIAPEDIENIWLSFYRVDKAHSRDEGRFGIGLSIVKAIQDLHGMPYGVTNEENGVTFNFDIKKV